MVDCCCRHSYMSTRVAETMDSSNAAAASSTWNSLSPSETSGVIGTKDNTVVNLKDVDEMLVTSLNNLSVRDRTVIQEEVHGVGSLSPVETPEMVGQAQSRLQEELDKLPLDSKIFYDRAVSLKSEYVNSADLRTKFLRAELFDANKAALRFMNYLKFCHKYFGDIALMRPLRFEDLTKEEQEIMRTGHAQILSSRDRSGRLVQFFQQHVPKGEKKIPPLENRVGVPQSVVFSFSRSLPWENL